MYSKFLKKNKTLLKESRSFRNSRSLARRKRKVFESYDDNIKKAWEDFKDSYDYPNLADAVLNELGDNIRDQFRKLYDMYSGDAFGSHSSVDMQKFLIENEDDILALVDDTATKDTYQYIIETLIRNGLYSMCRLLCEIAASNVAHALFDDIYLGDLDDDEEDEEYDEDEED